MLVGLMVKEDCGDLVVRDGGVCVGGTSAQTVEHVIVAMRGEFKEHPLLGGEIRKMMHGCGQRARDMCRAAGVRINRISVRDDGTIIVE